MFTVPSLIVIGRVLWPLHLPLLAKIAIGILLLVASQFHLWSRLSSGSVFAPEFPRSVVILFNWAFGTILLLAALQLLLDAGTLVAMLVRRGGVAVPDAARYAIVALAAVLGVIGVQQALRAPAEKRLEIAIPGLPPAFDGYTLLQLTDLHISRLFPADWTRTIVDRSNALGADLIVVTGDFIDGSLSARRADVEPLRELSAPDGVLFVPGNHEYFFEYDAWIRYFGGMNMRGLANEHTVLQREGDRLVVAGVTDLSAHRTGDQVPDLAAALDGAPAGVPVVLLDHQPARAREAAARGVALQLSGHTHGGMILGLDRVVAMANGGFVSGLYAVGGMTLYVNNGTALWPGFALRLGRPSELTLITLRRPG